MQGPRGPNQFSSDETADALPAVAPNGSDSRAVIAVTLAGIAAFFNLYATQPLLPMLEQIFHASKSQVGRTVSAATLGVALSAPLCGALAERDTESGGGDGTSYL